MNQVEFQLFLINSLGSSLSIPVVSLSVTSRLFIEFSFLDFHIVLRACLGYHCTPVSTSSLYYVDTSLVYIERRVLWGPHTVCPQLTPSL